jgi:hypothetical protein
MEHVLYKRKSPETYQRDLWLRATSLDLHLYIVVRNTP